MIATPYTPPDNPIGAVSFFATLMVLAALFTIKSGPGRVSVSRRVIAGLLVGLLLPAAWGVLHIRRESAHRDGIQEMEALMAFFILLAGAFGAALACLRRGAGWLIVEGLCVCCAAAAVIIWVAIDMTIVFPQCPVETPVRTAATILVVTSAISWSVVGLILRLRRSSKST